jgi:hypothetical protein
MFYLPNRAYYPAVRTLSHDQLTETVGHVLQYAALEFLSLAVLCMLLDRLLGISTLRLLAFTLRKHAALVQAQLTMWVLISTQVSLEHFGTWVKSAVGVCVFLSFKSECMASRVRLHVSLCMAAISSRTKHTIPRRPLCYLKSTGMKEKSVDMAQRHCRLDAFALPQDVIKPEKKCAGRLYLSPGRSLARATGESLRFLCRHEASFRKRRRMTRAGIVGQYLC